MLVYLIQGGSMMIPLLICSIAAIAVLIDRLAAFRAYNKIDNRALRAELMTLMQENRVRDAKNLCAKTPGPISAVLLAGIQAYEKVKALGGSPESLRMIVAKTMEDYTPHAINAIESRFNILSTVGNSAPLFGMTGTVTGMIKSFGALAEAGSLDAGVVGAGISEALITTAAGLIIALVAVIPYNIFMGITERIGLEIEEASSELVDLVAVLSEAGK